MHAWSYKAKQLNHTCAEQKQSLCRYLWSIWLVLVSINTSVLSVKFTRTWWATLIVSKRSMMSGDWRFIRLRYVRCHCHIRCWREIISNNNCISVHMWSKSHKFLEITFSSSSSAFSLHYLSILARHSAIYQLLLGWCKSSRGRAFAHRIDRLT